jgi:hypothetical protein
MIMNETTKSDYEPKPARPADDKRELSITELDGVTGGNGKSHYNEASTTLASIQKGLHDTATTDIGKI